MKEYNKLVRDKVLDIIEEDNKKPIFRILDEKEYVIELKNKLLEEVYEFLKSDEVEELVDIGEVIHAILEFKKVTKKEYQEQRLSKKNEKGAFKKRYFLEKII